MRTLSTLLCSGALFVLLACNSRSSADNHKSSSSVTTEQQEEKRADKTTIALEAFQILDSDGGSGNVVLSMDKEGKCYLGKQFIGSITTAGELKSDKGQLLVTLQGEQLLSDNGKVVGIIKADGTISNGSGKDMSWGADGILTNSESGLKLVPADTKAKRAASMLLSSFFGFSKIESK